MLVIRRLPQRVDGNGYGSDLQRTEKGIDELGTIGEEDDDALLDADLQLVAKRVSDTIHPLGELGVGNALGPAFDGDVTSAPLGRMPIHEIASPR